MSASYDRATPTRADDRPRKSDDDCQVSQSPHDLSFTFDFDPQTVRVEPTPFGLVVDLPNGRQDGTPGGPALPIVVVEVALPPGMAVRDVETEAGDDVVLAERAVVAPLQPAAPGVRVCSHYSRVRDDGLVMAWPKPPVVRPDPKLYERAIALGRQPATVTNVDTAGVQSVATIVLRPLAVTENGALVLRRSIRVTVHVEPGRPAPDGEPETLPVRLGSHAQVERWVELTRSRVINPKTVIDLGSYIGRYLGNAEYLVITDDRRWDATTMRAGDPVGGDMRAEFERLAAWKRTKGLTARVVTVTDIMSGRYGTFAGSCRRDLQEVLREFVKFAHANWGTAWLLLGGDVDIVPARDVVGYVGGFSPAAADPPTLGMSFWAGTFLKVRADVQADTPLLRTSDGRRIPYDPTGTSGPTQLGWFFTDASYTMRSTVATGFVRVNGPAAQVNTELFWLTGDNTIPTDLYYADVAGYPDRPASSALVAIDATRLGGTFVRSCGGHDWDTRNNGLYGQWNFDNDLDGVHYRADVSVGRAPVGNATEARTFVDKVLHYEGAGGSFFSTAWLRKLLVVSANWGGRTDYWPASVLADGVYVKRAADDHAVLQLAAAPSSFGMNLISVVAESDQRELPFRLDASSATRGWRFARSATDASPSVITIPFLWGTIDFPVPSRWIVAYGAASEMAPGRFIIDDTNADGSMTDQEALRTQLAADVPHWSDVRRLYEDEIDLAPAGGAPPVEHLTSDRLHARLNEGQHVVSLSGHGYWGGCCGLEPSMRTTLANGTRTFIAYADSCLTNQFDVADAISESLLQNEHGGAVAYVGNTRFSWIGVGDDFQRHFFRGLPATRALGLLNDRRLTMLGASTGFWGVYNRWSIFSLNLIGDPEMRMWTRRPRRICLELPTRIRPEQLLTVQVLLDDHPVRDAVVTARQAAFVRQARTDHTGRVHLTLDGVASGSLAVTAYHPEAAVMTTTVEVRGLIWLDVEVLAIRALAAAGANGSMAVVARTADGERTLTVPPDRADLVALLGQRGPCEQRVRLLVGDGDVIEGAEVAPGEGAGQRDGGGEGATAER